MTAETNTPVVDVTEAIGGHADSIVEIDTAAVAEKSVKSADKAARKAKAKQRRKVKNVRAKAQPRAKERIERMNAETNNFYAGFGAFPGAGAFEKIVADATGRGEEAVRRSRKAAEELADIYRGNLDAFVEAGRIAASGAQSISQSVVAKSRDSIEQAATTVRSFAEAKSPTELLQLQSDYARSAFDRLVEDSSNLTESLVKLAGEAFQPLSNRASANVERFNDIVA
jgi:phasin family protein